MIPIDSQVTCSKVRVKPLLSPLCCPFKIFWPFTWSVPNLVQGLPSLSKWSLLIFKSHVQRPRSNHSFYPSVLSTLYILIPCLLASDRFCFYREDKPEFCTMGVYMFWNISCFRGKSSHSRIFHLFWDFTITGEGLQILTYARRIWSLCI